MTPRVSILIPCYNASATVERAVDSALAQTFPDIEVIVADDGSTDSSLEVLERYRGDARVAVHAEPHRGGNATRNRLLELARGEYLQFLDADDTLAPEKVAACLAAFGPDVDVVFTDREFHGGDAGQLGRYPAPDGDIVTYFIRNSVVTMLPVSRAADVRAVGGLTLRCRAARNTTSISGSRCTVGDVSATCRFRCARTTCCRGASRRTRDACSRRAPPYSGGLPRRNSGPRI